MTEPHGVVTVQDSDNHLWSRTFPAVHATGFMPVTEMRLICSCLDGADRRWTSENGYLVSAQTSFNTHTTPAMGDGYYGVAADGPLNSLTCLEGKGHDFVLPTSGEIHFELKLMSGSHQAWSDGFVSRSYAESVPATTAIVYFLHNGQVGASFGQTLLEAQGVKVYSHPIDPGNPALDGFLEELRKLVEERSNVHLVGVGRASEAALEIAQRVRGLTSVMIFSGSGLRFSPWSIGGETLPFVLCDHTSVRPRGGNILISRTVYAEAVVDRNNRDRGRIEVENIECPLYFFTGSDDQIWPSAAFSEVATQRRKAHHMEHLTQHRTFPSVGHDLGPEVGLPGLPTTERTVSHPSTGFRLSLGGKMGRQSRARRECWESLLEILNGSSVDDMKQKAQTKII